MKGRLLACAAVFALACAGGAASLHAAGAAAQKPGFVTFKVDQARTGFLPDGPRPPLKLRWKFQSREKQADIESFFSFSVDDGFSPASIHDGVVYAGGHDGWIYAIDAKSGRKIWEHKTGGHVVTTPQYRDGRVYTGSMDGYFRVLDARDGSLVWQTKFGARMWNGLRYSGMRATPVFAGGTVFLGG